MLAPSVTDNESVHVFEKKQITPEDIIDFLKGSCQTADFSNLEKYKERIVVRNQVFDFNSKTLPYLVKLGNIKSAGLHLYFEGCTFHGGIIFHESKLEKLFFKNCMFIERERNGETFPRSLAFLSSSIDELKFKNCILQNIFEINKGYIKKIHAVSVVANRLYWTCMGNPDLTTLVAERLISSPIELPSENRLQHIKRDSISAPSFVGIRQEIIVQD